MAHDPSVRMHLDVAWRGGTLTGEVGVEGEPPMQFTGWISLTAAIESLLAGELERREDPQE